MDYQFLSNKYSRIYMRIILKTNEIREGQYFENHHIIPKSLGGSDDKTNIARLMAREHFICHYLLTKMIEINQPAYHKMIRAFMCMIRNSTYQKRYMNSRLYEACRIKFSISPSFDQTGNKNSQYQTIWVSNFSTKSCKKVDVKELEKYTSIGFQKVRCLDFSKYDDNGNVLKKIKVKRIKKYIY